MSANQVTLVRAKQPVKEDLALPRPPPSRGWHPLNLP